MSLPSIAKTKLESLAAKLLGGFVARDLSSRAAQASRVLTNPDIRVQLRADMPPVLSLDDRQTLMQVLRQELAKQGETLRSVREINIVCPQKDPDLFPGHRNAAVEVGDKLAAAFQKQSRRLKITRADAICETVHLDRSGNQSLIHSLTARQVFGVNARRQKEKPIAFLDPARQDRPHYFIIADWFVAQGTTVANLASFLQHNGGHVLAIVSDHSSADIIPHDKYLTYHGKPENDDWLRAEFATSSAGRALGAVGFALAMSAHKAGIKVTANQALENVEGVLNRHGHSLKALTHNEATRLFRDLQGGSISYAFLMGYARKKPMNPAPGAKVTR